MTWLPWNGSRGGDKAAKNRTGAKAVCKQSHLKMVAQLVFALILLVINPRILAAPAEQSDLCDKYICPHFLDPVCGVFETQLISFANQCEFDAQNCRLRNLGKTLREGDCPDWHVFTA